MALTEKGTKLHAMLGVFPALEEFRIGIRVSFGDPLMTPPKGFSARDRQTARALNSAARTGYFSGLARRLWP
jgi:hypothetical protein